MTVLSGPNSRPVVLAYQAGASLGAFGLGVTQRLLEDPIFKIIGAVGDSSGAITATALIVALIEGKNDRDGGRQRAYQRISDTWQGMTDYQRQQTPIPGMLKIIHETQHQIIGQWRKLSENVTTPFKPFGFIDVWEDATHHMMQRQMEWFSASYAVTLPYCPINGFLDMMREKGNPFPFEALKNPGDLFVTVGATHVPKGADPYQAQIEDSRVFINGDINAHILAASGNLPGFIAHPTYVNSEPLRDGGFSANPHMDEAIRRCEALNAELIIIRTRPSEDPIGLNGRTPKTDDERRTFFNSILDQQLVELRTTHPHLTMHVIEPPERETFSHQKEPLWWWRPELRFHENDVRRRRNAGYQATNLFLATSIKTPIQRRKIRARVAPSHDMARIA